MEIKQTMNIEKLSNPEVKWTLKCFDFNKHSSGFLDGENLLL